jgi:hypothetical protein
VHPHSETAVKEACLMGFSAATKKDCVCHARQIQAWHARICDQHTHFPCRDLKETLVHLPTVTATSGWQWLSWPLHVLSSTISCPCSLPCWGPQSGVLRLCPQECATFWVLSSLKQCCACESNRALFNLCMICHVDKRSCDNHAARQ